MAEGAAVLEGKMFVISPHTAPPMSNLQSIANYYVAPPPGFAMDDNLSPPHINVEPYIGYPSSASAVCEWTCGFERTKLMYEFIPDPILTDGAANFKFLLHAPFCGAHEKDDQIETKMRQMRTAQEMRQRRILRDIAAAIPQAEASTTLQPQAETPPQPQQPEVGVAPQPQAGSSSQSEASSPSSVEVETMEITVSSTNVNTTFKVKGELM
jgi:hypothetical protein